MQTWREPGCFKVPSLIRQIYFFKSWKFQVLLCGNQPIHWPARGESSFNLERRTILGQQQGDQVVCRITLENPRLPWDRVEVIVRPNIKDGLSSTQVSILVEYLPPTSSMPAAFSPCPEAPPQQLRHQLRVELEERREALPVVWIARDKIQF